MRAQMNSSQRLFIIGIVVVLSAGTAGTLAYTLALSPRAGEDRLSVVATFYPLAYFAEQIGGEHVVVRTLIPHNLELHSWKPSASDILAVEESDIFVYNGAGLEPWVVRDILPAITSKDKVIVEASKGLDLSALNEHVREGEAGDGQGLLDPHTWIDPVLARGEAEAILEAFVKVDPEGSDAYRANAQRLFDTFDSMDASYESELADVELNTIIVAHDAFGYLGRRYGFEVIGVVGLSAEAEPSTSDLVAILDVMVEKGIPVLFVTPFYTEYIHSLRESLEQRTGLEVTILTLYTLTGPLDGMDYFDQMEANLENLKSGLNA